MAWFRSGIILFLIILITALVFMSKGEIDMSHYLEGPSKSHIFGFDYLGRDLFSRSCYGLVVSLSISALSCLFSLVIAFTSLVISRREGPVRSIVTAGMKAVRTVPAVLFALFLLSFDGNAVLKLVSVLSFSGGCSLFLLLEPLIGAVESQEYIIAERSLGISEMKIFIRHIVPAMKGVILEHLSSSFITSVLTESSLSFLSLGLDPSIPTLGRILSEGRSVAITHPHAVLLPALLLFLSGLSVLLMQRGLSELDSPLHRAHQC